jgi:hypothetical protein
MARRLLDRSRRREIERQNLLLDRLTRQFRGRIRNELSAAMRDMVSVWEQTHAVMMPRGFRDRMEAVYQQMALAAVTAFGGRILEQGKSAGFVLERKEDFSQTMRRVALGYIQQESIRRRITDVTETTRRQIVGAVDRGYQDGIGTAEVARNIRGLVNNLASFRADAIARTETHGAANFGSDSAAKLTGLPLKREWLAAKDERTRESHAEADGQIVGPEEPFQVGGALLMYPGDPSGPGNEVINCRCVLGYVIEDGLDMEDAAPELAPAPPPASQFGYETAQMPNTVEEAVKFIADSGIALNTRLDGMRIVAMQGAFRAAMEVTERFGLDPLTGVGPSTRFGLKRITNANAAIARANVWHSGQYRRVNVLHLPVAFGDVAEYERQRLSSVKSATRYKSEAAAKLAKLQASGAADARVVERFARLADGEFSWTYSSLLPASEAARVITYHEYGHVLHLIDKDGAKRINEFLAREKPRLKGWQYLVSKYGDQDDLE